MSRKDIDKRDGTLVEESSIEGSDSSDSESTSGTSESVSSESESDATKMRADHRDPMKIMALNKAFPSPQKTASALKKSLMGKERKQEILARLGKTPLDKSITSDVLDDSLKHVPELFGKNEDDDDDQNDDDYLPTSDEEILKENEPPRYEPALSSTPKTNQEEQKTFFKKRAQKEASVQGPY